MLEAECGQWPFCNVAPGSTASLSVSPDSGDSLHYM